MHFMIRTCYSTESEKKLHKYDLQFLHMFYKHSVNIAVEIIWYVVFLLFKLISNPYRGGSQ